MFYLALIFLSLVDLGLILLKMNKQKISILGGDRMFFGAFTMSDKAKFFDSLTNLPGCCNRFCEEIKFATLFVAIKDIKIVEDEKAF